MKKTYIYLFIIIFFVLNISQVKADNYQTTSPYWSTEKNGPTSKQEAIDMFFKDRTLDPIEGIWMMPDWGMVAITKREDGYVQYVVDIEFEGLNGTQETTYFKTEDPNVFNFFERISWPDGNWYIFKTSAGTLILKDDNLAEITFVEEFAQNITGGNKIEKIWPVDLYASSNNIDEKIIKDKDEWVDKTSSLDWINLFEEKQFEATINEIDGKISIGSDEFYLIGEDINQYSWWTWGGPDYESKVLIRSTKGGNLFIETDTVGYVKIDDWKNVDTNQWIKEMNESIDELYKEKKEKNLDYVTKISWLEVPKLDRKNNMVFYSYKTTWNNGGISNDSRAIILGKNGYNTLILVTDYDEKTIKENNDRLKNKALTFRFNEGVKYKDYKTGDKVAALGIGGLVAGTLGVKALAKAGILAKFLPLLAKFWWIIIAPIVAFFGFLGKNDSSEVSRRRKRRK